MLEIELIAQLKAGSQSAVRLWYEQYQDRVVAYIKGKISNDADAEEIMQDVFLNALRQLPLFRGDSQLMTWMLSITRHEIADYYRKKYAKKVLKLLPLEIEGVTLDTQSEGDVAEAVHVVLTHLEPAHHELLLLKYIDNKSVAEIAKELKRSIKAIESDLFRARSAFRQLYIQHAQTTF